MIGRTRIHPLPLTLAAVAAAGAAISGYLTYVHLADQPVICGGQASCATVQSSEYASVGGVPVALLGLIFYLTIGVLAIAASARPVLMLATFGLALGGTLYSAYLTWIEVAVLEAICFWCVASALIMCVLLLVSGTAALRGTAASPPRTRIRQRVPG